VDNFSKPYQIDSESYLPFGEKWGTEIRKMQFDDLRFAVIGI